MHNNESFALLLSLQTKYPSDTTVNMCQLTAVDAEVFLQVMFILKGFRTHCTFEFSVSSRM